jgi:hypothetical protein
MQSAEEVPQPLKPPSPLLLEIFAPKVVSCPKEAPRVRHPLGKTSSIRTLPLPQREPAKIFLQPLKSPRIFTENFKIFLRIKRTLSLEIGRMRLNFVGPPGLLRTTKRSNRAPTSCTINNHHLNFSKLAFEWHLLEHAPMRHPKPPGADPVREKG